MDADEVKHFNYCIPKAIQFDIAPKGPHRGPPAPGMEKPPYNPDEFERHPPIVWSNSSVCINPASPFLSNKTVDCFVENADPSLRVIVTQEREPYKHAGLFPQCGHQKFEGAGRDTISDAYHYQLGTLEKSGKGWTFKLQDIPWEVASAHFLFDPRESNVFSNIYTWRSQYGEVSGGSPWPLMIEDNDWLEGAEIQPFIETIARDILPSAKDPRWAAIEKALIQAASPEHNYIGILDVETSDFLRRRMRISSVPSSEEIQSRIDALRSTAVSRHPPPYGLEESVRRLPDGFSSLEEYAKYADRLDTPGTSIKLMGLGSVGRGGYLADTGEVVFTLPTKTSWGRVELDLAAMANSGTLAGKELVRDWTVVAKHWRKTGKLNLHFPNLGKLQKAGMLRFGEKQVSVYTSGDVETSWIGGELTGLQSKIGRVAKSMEEKYLSELARRGVRDIVFVSPEKLKEIFDAGASALARQGATLMPHDSHNGILLLKQASGKFTVQPSGVYDSDKRRIYLSSPDALLHEMAHADEAVRKSAGILDRETLNLANQVQNGLIQSGDQTVSDHPEVLAHSPSGAEERRADGLVIYWTDPDRLKSVDPDLFNYFATVTHKYQREKEGDGQCLVKNQNPFSSRYGDLTKWALENALDDSHFVSCLLFAGELNNWVVSDGHRRGPLQCLLKTPAPEESYQPGGGAIPDWTR